PLLSLEGLRAKRDAAAAEVQSAEAAALESLHGQLARTNADLAITRAAAAAQAIAAPRAATKPELPGTLSKEAVDITPHFDTAQMLRGMTLHSSRQKLNVRVIRDGADVPIRLEVRHAD